MILGLSRQITVNPVQKFRLKFYVARKRYSLFVLSFEGGVALCCCSFVSIQRSTLITTKSFNWTANSKTSTGNIRFLGGSFVNTLGKSKSSGFPRSLVRMQIFFPRPQRRSPSSPWRAQPRYLFNYAYREVPSLRSLE